MLQGPAIHRERITREAQSESAYLSGE